MQKAGLHFTLPSFDDLKSNTLNPSSGCRALSAGRAMNVIAPSVPAPRLKVAAYCRVSTDKEDQKSSIRIQREHFLSEAEKHPDWEFAGIYADIISGTKKEKRPELQRLLGDCAIGKVNLVMTKSISRFARNTTDLLEMVRSLTANGTDIRFERENLDTRTMGTEFLLTILASLAEDESHSFSANCRWGLQQRFADGTYRAASAPYGYDLNDGTYVVNTAEAEVVREIFNRVLAGGESYREIADSFNERGIPTKRAGQKWKGKEVSGKWTSYTIAAMLSNEAYIGDLLLQKSYKDRNFKMRTNNGELPQYYLEGHHAAIISRDVFDRMQVLREDRKMGPCSDKIISAFSGKLFCAHCGAKLWRTVNRNGAVSWVCRRHKRKASDCPAESVPEQMLWDDLSAAVGTLRKDDAPVLEYLSWISTEFREDNGARLSELETRRGSLEKQILGLTRSKERLLPAEYVTEQNRMKNELDLVLTELDHITDKRIQETEELLTVLHRPGSSFLFNEDTFTELVESVTVTGKGCYGIRFRGGFTTCYDRREKS